MASFNKNFKNTHWDFYSLFSDGKHIHTEQLTKLKWYPDSKEPGPTYSEFEYNTGFVSVPQGFTAQSNQSSHARSTGWRTLEYFAFITTMHIHPHCLLATTTLSYPPPSLPTQTYSYFQVTGKKQKLQPRVSWALFGSLSFVCRCC